MPPVSEHKPKQFAFVLSTAEHLMLEDLAAREGMSKANLVRLWIRKEYERKYPGKLPGASVARTLRAVIGELARPDRQTVESIAERVGLAPDRLAHYLERVSIKTARGRNQILEVAKYPGRRGSATWELVVPRDKALEAIEAAGFDLDEPLGPTES